MVKGKVLSAVIIIIALAMAICVTAFSQDVVMRVVMPVSRFFEVMIPILAAGALIKYVGCCGHCKCCDKCTHCGKDNGHCHSHKD